MKIEVVKWDAKQVVSKKTGEIFNLKEVEGYVHGLGKYPTQVKFTPPKGHEPPVPGMYTIAPSSYFVDRFGSLQLRSSLELVPMVAGASSSKVA